MNPLVVCEDGELLNMYEAAVDGLTYHTRQDDFEGVQAMTLRRDLIADELARRGFAVAPREDGSYTLIVQPNAFSWVIKTFRKGE